MKSAKPMILLASMLLVAVATADDFVVTTQTSNLPLSTAATYSCVFQNLWNGNRHPVQYPEASAHWSSPVVASHGPGYQMWAPGVLASPGVEQVAEVGGTGTIQSELRDSDAVLAVEIGSVTFNRDVQQQTLEDLQVDESAYLVSSITMIAPSPDWFTGFYDFDVRDLSTDTWLGQFQIDTYPWDAGTETGTAFSTGNPAQEPPEPIFQYTIDSAPDNGIWADPDGVTVLPVASWTCDLITNAPSSARPSSFLSLLLVATVVVSWGVPTIMA